MAFHKMVRNYVPGALRLCRFFDFAVTASSDCFWLVARLARDDLWGWYLRQIEVCMEFSESI